MKIVLCIYYCGQIYLVSLNISLITFYNYKYKNAYTCIWASLVALVVKNLPANIEDVRDTGLVPRLGRSPEGRHATHFSILAWRIPWTEEPGRLQSMGWQSWTWLKWLSMHTCIYYFKWSNNISKMLYT